MKFTFKLRKDFFLKNILFPIRVMNGQVEGNREYCNVFNIVVVRTWNREQCASRSRARADSNITHTYLWEAWVEAGRIVAALLRAYNSCINYSGAVNDQWWASASAEREKKSNSRGFSMGAEQGINESYNDDEKSPTDRSDAYRFSDRRSRGLFYGTLRSRAYQI